MESQTINAAEFRDAQQQQWDKASTGWKKHSDFIDRSARQISERLVELAGVKPGSRVLDVAAGYGEPTLTAARVAGPEGKVVSSDISEGMLAYGRERAAAEGLDNIDFVQSAAVALDFPEGSFDAAVSRWGIIFDPDGEGAAAKVRSLLEPGSRMAIASWGPPDRVPFLAVAVKTVVERLGVAPPPPGTPGPMSRPTPETIGGLLEGGGFSDVEVEEAEVTFEMASAEEYTTFVREIAPPVTAMMAGHPENAQAETWEAITAAAAAYAGADGKVAMTNLVLLASGSA